MTLFYRVGIGPGLLASLLALGCATLKGTALHLKENYQAPDLVGGLPPNNESTDLAAPDTFRRVMATVLVSLGYLPMVSPAQEEALRRMGIQEGGQEKAFPSEKISSALGTDGLLLGKVEDFNDLNIGIYRSRKVTGTAFLTSTLGEKLWEAQGRAVNRKFSGDVGQGLAEGLARKMVEKILKIHLLEEASRAAVLMGTRIPEWPEPLPAKLKAIRKDLN
ncbi:MAG: DUF799 family lipoprotein [Elusimicrobia bacterium]|nr:DUF799 family lipoprotein [Elusimicrobiota bacterium]